MNLQSLLAERATIEIDEEGNEIDPTVDLKITVNDENVHSTAHRKDETDITVDVYGKGTVTVKVWIGETMETMKQFVTNLTN